jgi:hypothetical protein
MRSGLRSAILGAIARLRRDRHQERPYGAENERDRRDYEDDTAAHRQTPTSDVLRAEWTALQTLIREIHRSEEQHQASERELGAAQLRTAKGLNWVTGIGAVVGVVGLLIVGGSLVVAIRTANDARDALHASQRPWIVADRTIFNEPAIITDTRMSVNVTTTLKNAGRSIGTKALTWINLAFNGVTLGTNLVEDPCTVVNRNRKSVPANTTYFPGAVLAPRDEVNGRFVLGSDKTLDPHVWKLIRRSGYTGIFLLGCTKYFDQFNIEHTTRFCFREQEKPDVNNMFKFEHCGSYEDAN